MWFNPILSWLLRSPLHIFVSKNMMLISYTGRKSGRLFTTPVNYYRLLDARGEYLVTFSNPQRVWWRSLRGGATVTLLLQGRTRQAWAEAIEDPTIGEQSLRKYLEQQPAMARYFGVKLNPNGSLDEDSLRRSAGERVTVQTRFMG